MKNIADITVLFVDDEADILSSLNRFLRREPYKKLFAENGKKALSLLEEHAVALVVTDLRMPEMNGLELISAVKERNPDVIRLILSGSQDFDQIIESINKGEVFRFIPKPVDPDAFRKVLNDAIDYYCLKTEREELFNELSIKNRELTRANDALRVMAGDLQRSEEKFRSMTDAAHDAVFMLNNEGKIVYRNTAAETLFGFSREEYGDQLFWELISPEFADFNIHDVCEMMPDEALPDFNSETRVRQIEGLRKDGSLVPIEISRGCVHIESVHHTVVIARDITARVEAERSRERYDSMQKELESEIERKLLQSPVPETLQGVSISRLMIPSGHLDGDFTDFIVYNSRHADIIIGDVMGHGIQSALVGAGIKALFLKAIAQKKRLYGELPDLTGVVSSVHDLCIHELMALGTFATLLFLRLDLEAGELSLIDCGHPPVLHFNDATGTISMLKGEQLPIGMIERQDYLTVSASISENDLLVFYSDGITESFSPDGRMFGIERLVELVINYHDLPAEALIEHIKEGVSSFAGRDTFDDDVTCIVIRIGTLTNKTVAAGSPGGTP
ncbi:MAG: SpoIIE family protein phosphatase [Chlorobium sp.]|jgi:PAS domain S-box-containing protein|nr:SpoIIE family protein phosphatase [Chlorobium sp.]